MRRLGQLIGGALGGSTLLLVLLWGVDEIQFRRIERAGLRRR